MEQNTYISVLCSWVLDIYQSADREFVVSRFREKGSGKVFTATGSLLPHDKNIVVKLTGEWKTGQNKGREFQVKYFDIPPQTDKDGIIAYLQSLRCGIGYKKALAVYETFGENTWQVIDNYPYELTNVSGISSVTIKNMVAKITVSGEIRRFVELCANANISLTAIQMKKVMNALGDNAVEQIMQNPYVISGIQGISFEKADALAEGLALPKDFPPRLEAAIMAVLDAAAMKGHSCLPKQNLYRNDGTLEVRSIVNELKLFTGVEEDKCTNALNAAWKKGLLKSANGYLFTTEKFNEEEQIAINIQRLFSAEHRSVKTVEAFIEDYEKENVVLADKQKEAVRMVFENQVNIITGGPGTGKTTVIKAILYTHKMVYGENSQPVLLAPTGKAARRMSVATGFAAQTIHSAIGFKGDDVPADTNVFIDGNLVIIDESSMLDQRIAAILLSKISTGAKVIFVGDVDQLPSVGYGNILMDMINSHVIPTVRLNVIFRQAEENPIIENLQKINHGDTNLNYTKTFRIIETHNNNEAFQEACKLYYKCVQVYGINNVILLNPQRNNTELSVDAFNVKLQELLHKNPKLLGIEEESKLSIDLHGVKFRKGDRIMQTKNTEVAKNGDIGIIRDIVRTPDVDNPNLWIYTALIEFNEDGKILEYDTESMQYVDLAYCSTIHKVQGDEFKTVIEVVSQAHPSFLTRKLIFTGISRSQCNLAIVGEKKAVETAIMQQHDDKRCTLLGKRLAYLLKI